MLDGSQDIIRPHGRRSIVLPEKEPLDGEYVASGGNKKLEIMRPAPPPTTWGSSEDIVPSVARIEHSLQYEQRRQQNFATREDVLELEKQISDSCNAEIGNVNSLSEERKGKLGEQNLYYLNLVQILDKGVKDLSRQVHSDKGCTRFVHQDRRVESGCTPKDRGPVVPAALDYRIGVFPFLNGHDPDHFRGVPASPGVRGGANKLPAKWTTSTRTATTSSAKSNFQKPEEKLKKFTCNLEHLWHIYFDLFERVRECLTLQRETKEIQKLKELTYQLEVKKRELEQLRKKQPKEIVKLVSKMEQDYDAEMKSLDSVLLEETQKLENVKQDLKKLRKNFAQWFPELEKCRINSSTRFSTRHSNSEQGRINSGNFIASRVSGVVGSSTVQSLGVLGDITAGEEDGSGRRQQVLSHAKLATNVFKFSYKGGTEGKTKVAGSSTTTADRQDDSLVPPSRRTLLQVDSESASDSDSAKGSKRPSRGNTGAAGSSAPSRSTHLQQASPRDSSSSGLLPTFLQQYAFEPKMRNVEKELLSDLARLAEKCPNVGVEEFLELL
ncbi:unnamed protein product [Amoebophrya sp. A120]|nr:unnamed protein product [Amoebophrya sp. A120]|eukprot:GSA120T00020738001.1